MNNNKFVRCLFICGSLKWFSSSARWRDADKEQTRIRCSRLTCHNGLCRIRTREVQSFKALLIPVQPCAILHARSLWSWVRITKDSFDTIQVLVSFYQSDKRQRHATLRRDVTVIPNGVKPNTHSLYRVVSLTCIEIPLSLVSKLWPFFKTSI